MWDLEMRGSKAGTGGSGRGEGKGVEKEKVRSGEDSWMTCLEACRGEDGREEAK